MNDDISFFDERLARLQAEADCDRTSSFPPAWDRLMEPRLAGTLERVREVQTQHGIKEIAEIKRMDGSYVDVWLTPKKLRDEWAAEHPQIGEFLLISFHGDIPMLGRNPMADIRVRVDRTDQGQAVLAAAV
jgi:hypothetical protein